jgi:hypothetical protein
MWRSFASAKLSRRLFGPAMGRLGTERTMSRTVNARMARLPIPWGLCEGWRGSHEGLAAEEVLAGGMVMLLSRKRAFAVVSKPVGGGIGELSASGIQ